jgi:hypothetical protein
LATYITNFIATYITPISNSLVKFIGVGQSSNTSYINFQIPFGAAAATFGWTSVGSPTYSQFELVTGSATGVYKPLGINLDTGVTYNWSNTKIKILEWTAKINSDTSTATSFMGFTSDGTAGFDWDSSSRYIVGFGTKADGTWACVTGNSTTSTKTVITTPTAAKHTFRVEYNSSSEAKFYIDGVLVSTNTTNLPTSSGDNIGISFTNGTSSIIIGAISAINVAIQK